MIKDFQNIISGNDVPMRSCKEFYLLGKKHIVRDKKARRLLQKETGKKYFGSYKDFTKYAAKQLQKDLERGL